jgi:hypothetical protein
MLKTSVLFLLLFSQEDPIRIAGHINWESRIRTARVLLMGRNGIQVQRTLVLRDGTFEFKDVPEGQYTLSMTRNKSPSI